MLIDEAHNIGNKVEEIYSEILDINLVDSAIEQIESLKNRSVNEKGEHYEKIEILNNILLNLSNIFETHKNIQKKRPTEIDSSLFINSVFRDIVDSDRIDSVISDIYDSTNSINNNNDINSEDEIEPLSRVIQFLYNINDFNRNIYTPFILMKKLDDNDLNNVVFEVKSIDPSFQISKIADLHYTTIMMSGTFFPVEDYELYYFGNNDRAEKCTLPNSFKSENRLIIGVTDVTTRGESRDDPKIIKNYNICIETIIKTHGNVGFFFNSHAYKNKYQKFILKSTNEVGKEYFDQKSNSKNEKVFNNFIDAAKKNGGVLTAVCGGILSEGLDYGGDSLKAAMVISLPLVPLKGIQEKKKEYYENLHGREYGSFIAYRLPAMNKALQAIGRVIRGKNETGILVLADDRFTNDGKLSVGQYLPNWIKNEMIRCKSMEIEGEINNWVENKKLIEKPIVKSIRKEPKRVNNWAISENIIGNLDLFKEKDKIHESLMWIFNKYKYDDKLLMEINDKISEYIDSVENLNVIPNIPNVESYLTQLSIEFKKESERLLSEKDNKKIRRELEDYVIL